jgi:hypothetical protein
MMHGSAGIAWMSLSAAACAIPAWLACGVVASGLVRSDVGKVLLPMAIRMLPCLCVALIVSQVRPELGVSEFYGWLVGFYLLALAVETVSVQSAGSGASRPARSAS